MDSIIRAALAAGSTGRKAPIEESAEWEERREPPPSPSPAAVRFGATVTILPLKDLDELRHSSSAVIGAGEDVEKVRARSNYVWALILHQKKGAPSPFVPPQTPSHRCPTQASASPPMGRTSRDYMAMTFTSLVGDKLHASQNADLTAMALIGLSAFIYSLQTLNVKFLGGHFDSWTSTFFRGVVGTALCLIDARFFRSRDHCVWGQLENRRMLLLRGFLGGLTIASAFFAVQAMDLAEASVLIFTAPLWTAMLSKVLGIGYVRAQKIYAASIRVVDLFVVDPLHLYFSLLPLKHTHAHSAWGLVDSCSAAACLLGMVMVTQPPFLVGGRAPDESTSFVGVVAALFSALTAAGVNITISKLKGEPATTITLYAM